MNKLFYWFFVAFGILSCSEGEKNNVIQYETDVSSWTSIERSQILGGIDYKASQVPIQYYIQKNLGFEAPTAIDSVAQTLNTERVIVLEFRDLEEKDLLLPEFTNMTYENAVKYMAFNIQKDLHVKTSSGKVIPCSGVNFERNFKVAPFKRILLHFGDVAPDETVQLVYDDQLFGNGIIKFKFNEIPIKL